MTATVNGADVLELTIVMPSQGAWVADLEADADELASDVTIDDGEGNRFSGRVLRPPRSLSGRLGARVVAGKGGIAGLTTTLEPRHFRDVPLRLVVNELLAQTGERLAATSQAAVLARHLPFWSIAGGSPGAALRTLLDRTGGGSWRMLADGSLWLGVDAYPAAPTFEHDELDRDDVLGLAELAVDAFSLRPGVTLDGFRVGRVEHCIAEAGLRTVFNYG